MAVRRLTAKERRELPARAFGIPSSRKYPVMVLNRSGEPVPSKGHAVDAKARAMEGLEKGRIDRRQYNQIVRKADSAIKTIDRARKKAKRNPAKKKKATKRKVAARKVSRRKATWKKVSHPEFPLHTWAPSSSVTYTVKRMYGSMFADPHEHVYSVTRKSPRSTAEIHSPGVDPKHINKLSDAKAFAEKDFKKKTTRRRKNPELTPKQKSYLFTLGKADSLKTATLTKRFGRPTVKWSVDNGFAVEETTYVTISPEGMDAVREFAPTSTLEEEAWEGVVDEARIAADRNLRATPWRNPKKKASRRRKNPSEADHERVGMEALRNSHEYWDGYIADKSKTNLLVDAYKFLVIAHEELKYAGDAEPRLEADHMLKAAHKELSRKLK